MLVKPYLFASLCLLTGLFAATQACGDALRPGIIGTDDRRPFAKSGPPWDAIGQVNIGGYRRLGQCTGTLIAPDVVVTAAHCVIDRRRKAPFRLHNIHFLAGVKRAEHQGHSTAKCLHLPDGAPAAFSTDDAWRNAVDKDVAVIILKERLAVTPAEIAAEDSVQEGRALTHVAYPADRRYMLSAHENCRLLDGGGMKPLWLSDCDTHPASSGGPIFVTSDGMSKLAAIMLGTTGRQANVALPVSRWKELIGRRDCP